MKLRYLIIANLLAQRVVNDLNEAYIGVEGSRSILAPPIHLSQMNQINILLEIHILQTSKPN